MANAKKFSRITKFLFPATTHAGAWFDEINGNNPLAFFFMFMLLPWLFFAFILDICYLTLVAGAVCALAYGAGYVLALV